MAVTVVYAREPIPAEPSVFLAGPTPRDELVRSWRPDAIAALDAAWAGPERLTVLSPESRGGIRAQEYDDQVRWEWAALDAASVILFWIPRDLATLPGFTTNVEFGLYAQSGRVVLGVPDCPNPERNRYLIALGRRFGVPVRDALAGAVQAALGLLESGRSAAPAAQVRPAAPDWARGSQTLPVVAARPGHLGEDTRAWKAGERPTMSRNRGQW
ncbi:MAG: nucleoside 2-deoxyribosyltransferase domain-containing protein [Actinoplanes sp.]